MSKKVETHSHNWFYTIVNLVVGNLMMGAAYSIFVVPENIVAGGSGGIGVILRGFLNIDPSLFVTIFMWVLCLVSWIVLGRSVAIKTLPSTVLYPASIYLFNAIVPLQNWAHALNNPLLAACFAGALYGVGSAYIFRVGGTGGGTDIIALIIEKYTGWHFEKVIFWQDVVIIAAGVYFVGFESSLIGIVLCFISMEAIDRVMFGGSETMMLFIMTSHLEDVNTFILTKLNRGTTIVQCLGGYTKSPRQMIQTVVSRQEYKVVEDFVNQHDSHAFITVLNAKETFGEGFRQTKRRNAELKQQQKEAQRLALVARREQAKQAKTENPVKPTASKSQEH